MYSNNDFRYYKEGEYLAHYGVKGMKWKKHLKKRFLNAVDEGDTLNGYRSKKTKRRATAYKNAYDVVSRVTKEADRDAKRLKRTKHKNLSKKLSENVNSFRTDPRRKQMYNLSKKLNKSAFGK